MNDDLFLIAHKVRGELAFDIATMLEVGDEVWWIIPTSGHRAYPATYIHLVSVTPDHVKMMSHTNLDNVRDHYSVLAEAASPAKRASVSRAPSLEDI